MAKKAGKIALGLGLITGGLAGLLFAPEEGKKIREKLAKGDHKGLLGDLQTMAEEIKDIAVDFGKKPSVKEAVSKAKDKAAEVANMERKELDKLLKTVSEKADKLKKSAEQYVKEQKAHLDKAVSKKKSSKKPATKKTAAKKTTPKKKAPAKKKSTTKKSTTAKKAPAKKTTKKSTPKKK
jgi:gas vesicle protein